MGTPGQRPLAICLMGPTAAGKTDLRAVDQSVERLRSIGAQALGGVLNQFDADEARRYGILNFTDRQIERKGAAVVAQANYFAPFADNSRATGPPVLGQIVVVFAAEWFRHEHRDISTHHFIPLVPEHP